jgi:Subtilase family
MAGDDCAADHGARVLNLSLAVTRSSSKDERALKLALDHAARRGVLIVAAAGNQGAGEVGAIAPYLKVLAQLDRYQRATAPLVYDKAARDRLFAKLNRIAAQLERATAGCGRIRNFCLAPLRLRRARFRVRGPRRHGA